jgi:hypothetical protein
MNLSLKTREILWFLLIALLSYATIIVVFAWFYYESNGIGFYIRPTNTMEKVTFWKAVYFSVVTFHTIGFGDIFPVNNQGRTIMMFQSFLSLFFYSIFSGFLVYFVIQRPTDVLTTKNVYIRHRKDQWSLSIRLGNKGRPVIDMKGRFEGWIVKYNTRIRVFKYEEEMADLERILYFDINLDDPANTALRDALKQALAGEINLHMKFSFVGNNVRHGDQVAFTKYYDTSHIRFGTMFQNVYSWDESGHRTDFRWKNFERIDEMPDIQKNSF